MSTQGPNDPLQEILSKTQQLISQVDRLQQDVAIIHASALLDALREIAGLKPEIVGVKNLAEQLEAGQQSLLGQSRQALIDIGSLPQKPHTVDPSLLLDIKSDLARVQSAIGDVKSELGNVGVRQHADADRVSDQIKQQAESKIWKIAYVVIPVVLTAGLGAFISYKQIGTNQRIDAASKKLATRLALTEAFYKRKLAVYEEADKQMAAVVGCLEDLRLNPSDSAQTTAAFDNVRKLSDMAKTNGLYMTKEVSDGLSDVSFTTADSPPLNGKPGSGLKTITEKIDIVEAQMKKELEGFGSLD